MYRFLHWTKIDAKKEKWNAMVMFDFVYHYALFTRFYFFQLCFLRCWCRVYFTVLSDTIAKISTSFSAVSERYTHAVVRIWGEIGKWVTKRNASADRSLRRDLLWRLFSFYCTNMKRWEWTWEKLYICTRIDFGFIFLHSLNFCREQKCKLFFIESKQKMPATHKL